MSKPVLDRVHDEELTALLRRYASAIYAVLKQIHTQKLTKPDRYLILNLEGSNFYVQCKFYDDDRMLRCEAASGAYHDWSLTDEQTDILAALGYDVTKSDDNHAIEHPIADEPSLMYVPILLIETLYRVYGLTQETILRFEAPYVPGFNDLETLMRSIAGPAADR